MGCTDAHCLLCAQNQNRRCTRTFAGKYLAGDLLKAACGATIRCAGLLACLCLLRPGAFICAGRLSCLGTRRYSELRNDAVWCRVELVDRSTGRTVAEHEPLQLQASLGQGGAASTHAPRGPCSIAD